MSEQIIDSIYFWLFTSGLKTLFIVVISLIARFLIKITSKKIIRLMISKGVEISDHLKEKEERVRTLSSIFLKTGSVVIYVVALLMILSEFGLNITPLITGAGIVGLAIGFGAQTLVKDVISGLFILLEGQYMKGDKVKIDSIEGEVVEITLRKTMIKDNEGNLHHLPHSQIKVVTNLSRKEKVV